MNTATSDKQKQSNQRSGIRIADELFDILVSMGPGWHDRESIAAAREKALLNVSEKAALKLLVDTGRIEQRLIDVNSFNRRLEYRVADHPDTPKQGV